MSAAPERMDANVPVPSRALDGITWLARLRPDERERIAARFEGIRLAAGETVTLSAGDAPRLGVVVEGEVTLKRAELPGLPPSETRLVHGDRWGELAVFAGLHTGVEVIARTPTTIALLDEASFARIAAEFPVVWLEVTARLSRELKWKNDLLREIQEFDREAGARALELFLQAKRRRIARRKTGVARDTWRALIRAVIAEPARNPAFWILSGFVIAIAASRFVVAMILRFGLQEALFNLKDSGGANPIHTHHFNYGFALLITAALTAFLPWTRRWLLPLAFAFGVGLGLVFDEFALIWKLNPDYYDPLNYQAQAFLALVLLQIVYLRRFWVSLLARVRRAG